MSVAACPTLTFNIGSTATAYSVLAGVLAGFSFTGFQMLLASNPDVRRERGPVGRVLAAAFLALVLSGFDYASLAGAPVADGAAITEELLLGPGLAMSVILVLYAMVLILETVEPAGSDGVRPPTPIRGMVGRGAPVVAMFFVTNGVSDYDALRYGHVSPLTGTGFALCGVLLVTGLAIYPWWSRPIRNPRTARPERGRSSTSVAVAAFVFAICSALAFNVFDSVSGECDMLPPAVPYVLLGATFVLLVAISYLLARGGRIGNRPQQSDPQLPAAS
jgi:hypothetical protein